MEEGKDPPKIGHKALKQIENKDKQEFVIKQGFYKSVVTPDKTNFVNCISRRVESVSKGFQRLSFAVNLFVREQTAKGDPRNVTIPEDLAEATQLRQLTLGISGCSKIQPWVRDFLKRNDKHLPVSPKRYEEDTNSFTQLVSLYATNYKNYLHINFKKVQEKFVYTWGLKNNIPEKEVYILRLLINNWTLQKEPLWTKNIKVIKMVRFHQQILKIEPGNSFYPKNHFSTLIMYFSFISRYLKKTVNKSLTIAPISQIKSHYLKIDSDTLRGIFKELGYHASDKITFRSLITENYSTVLNIHKNLTNEQKSGKYKFTGTIETDGTGLCIHFKRKDLRLKTPKLNLKSRELKQLCEKLGIQPDKETIINIIKSLETKKIKEMKVPELKQICKLKLNKKQLVDVVTNEVLNSIDNKNYQDLIKEYDINFLDYLNKNDMLELLKDTEDYSPEIEYNPKTHRVIGNDPGRVNLFYGAEKLENNSFKYYKLSRKQFYHESGVYKARTNSEKWNSKIQHSLDLLSFTDKKALSKKEFLKYTKVVLDNYETFWSHFCQKKWSRQRFKLYSGKQKCYANFFNSLKDETSNKELVIAYGDAGFASTCKNEVSAPTTKIKTECRKRFKTVLIDEFRTSKIHSRTDTLLLKVKTEENKEVRGLLWCSSTIDSKFVNRDKNAAENMERIFTLETRPLIMSREGEKFPETPPVKIIPNSRTNKTSLGLQSWASDDQSLCHLENTFYKHLRVFQNILV